MMSVKMTWTIWWLPFFFNFTHFAKFFFRNFVAMKTQRWAEEHDFLRGNEGQESMNHQLHRMVMTLSPYVCLSPVDGNQTKFSKNPFCILNTIYARHSNYLSAARMDILIVDQAQQQPYNHAECMGIIVFGWMPSTGPPKIATQRQYSSENSRFLPFGNDSFHG